MIQLTAVGPRILKDDGWAARKREFAQRHCVVLEGFVDEAILGRVPQMLEAGRFHTFEHASKKVGVFSRELQMRGAERLPQMFFLLLNQPRLFAAIAELTGSEAAIRCFSGRCFKQLPSGEHFDSWHTDDNIGRTFGLTINLSSKPCGGGFQIRSWKTKEVFQTVTETRFGDACLFRIQRSLEHRALPVEGPEPRCVYGGWFISGAGADYREVLREKLRRFAQGGAGAGRPGSSSRRHTRA